MNQETQQQNLARRMLGTCWRMARRCIAALLLAVVAYALVVLLGLIPVNNDFTPSPDGVEIFVVSNPIHAEIVLPIKTTTIDWRDRFAADCFLGDTRGASHVAIGWGDRGFFIDTPTWSDMRVSTAAKALFWPSESCMHVTCTNAEYLDDDARAVRISTAQYERLVEFINGSFQRGPDGSNRRIEGARYGANDAFFGARGKYHCFNTCNCWAGRALKSCSVRTGWFTPLPKTVFLYLPD